MIQRIKDWWWFNITLGGDEFHKSLDINSKAVLKGKTTLSAEIKRIGDSRNRAHRLDMKYSKKKLDKVYKDDV
jgi:hypothetical protein